MFQSKVLEAEHTEKNNSGINAMVMRMNNSYAMIHDYDYVECFWNIQPQLVQHQHVSKQPKGPSSDHIEIKCESVYLPES